MKAKLSEQKRKARLKRDLAKDKKVKITPKNYEKLGYDYYYENDDGTLTFSYEDDDGYEQLFDEYGNKTGEMD